MTQLTRCWANGGEYSVWSSGYWWGLECGLSLVAALQLYGSSCAECVDVREIATYGDTIHERVSVSVSVSGPVDIRQQRGRQSAIRPGPNQTRVDASSPKLIPTKTPCLTV